MSVAKPYKQKRNSALDFIPSKFHFVVIFNHFFAHAFWTHAVFCSSPSVIVA